MNEVAKEYGSPVLDIPYFIYALLPAAFSPGVKHLPHSAKDSDVPTVNSSSVADPHGNLGASWVRTAAPHSFIQ